MTYQIECVEDKNDHKALQRPSVDPISQHYPGKDMCFAAVDLEKRMQSVERDRCKAYV